MKNLILLALLLVPLLARSANPAFTDFNTNSFNTATNKINFRGGTLNTLTKWGPTTNALGDSSITDDGTIVASTNAILEFGPDDASQPFFRLRAKDTVSGDGTGLIISSGNPGVAGHGADIAVAATDGVGADKNGGSIFFNSGQKTGAGTPGQVSFSAGNGGLIAMSGAGLELQQSGMYLSLSGNTNQYTDNGTNLLRNGVSISATSTNFVGIYRDQSIEAGAMFAGPTPATIGTYTNGVNDTLSDSWTFADAATQATRFALTFPDVWNVGTVKLKLYVLCDNTNSAGITNLVWGVKAGSLAPGEAATNAVFGTQVFITNGLATSGQVMQVFTSPAITVGGSPAMGDNIWFDVSRQGSNGSDTWTNVPIRLLKCRVQWLESSTAPSIW